MDTTKETAGKVKDWVVEYRWEIASAVVALGMGYVSGRVIGKTIAKAMEGAYHQGFKSGCDAVALGLAAENKDNPEILGPILKLTSELNKPV